MKVRDVVWLLALTSGCGKSTDIGDGLDPGGRSGEGGEGVVVDTGGEGGEGDADGSGGRGVASGGRTGGAGGTTTGEPGAPITGGAGGSTMGNQGARSGGGSTGVVTTTCTLPTNLELVEPSELSTNAWVPEHQCDSAATTVYASRVADDAATLDVKPLAGTWIDGSGAERIELIVDATGRGTLRFGAPADLPEVEPDEAYLTGIGERDAHAFDQFSYRSPLVPGFAYAIIPDQGRASEMTFAIRGSEPWSEWCRAQEPVRGLDCYACEFRADTAQYAGDECGERAGCYVGQSSEPDRYVRLHCGRLALCGGSLQRCFCSKGECTNNPSRTHGYQVTIDPVDNTVLRFHEEHTMEGTRYLTRVE